MVARLEKTQEGYAIRLTAEMVEELRLAEGAVVEVRPATNGILPVVEIRHLPREKALDLYERSKADFGEAYEALAK